MNKKPITAHSGQTLIETVVAIGILVTGIVGGVSLAIYALGTSDTTIKQIIATNLAREGVEIIRNMRDTNWLQDVLVACPAMGAGQTCYVDWDDENDNIIGSSGGTIRRLTFNANTNAWSTGNNNNTNASRLFLRPSGLYDSNGPGAQVFSRYVKITRDENAPFSVNNPRLKIQSTVWWTGKRCATVANFAAVANTTCKVTVEEYLTNWRNY